MTVHLVVNEGAKCLERILLKNRLEWLKQKLNRSRGFAGPLDFLFLNLSYLLLNGVARAKHLFGEWRNFMSQTIKSIIWASLISLAVVFAIKAINRGSLTLALEQAKMQFERKEHRLRYLYNIPLRGTPDFKKLPARLTGKGLIMGAPIFIRIFKAESELELWMKKGDRFVLFQTYPICRWSGLLGPKLREGDRQSPEGFYSVEKRQLNPRSRWHRSFNVGYPNKFDRSFDRTGSLIMVHGGCSSIGCFAVTNEAISEIWKIINASFAGGQKRFQVHTFPFRMTARNMAAHENSRWFDFWRNLKTGYDQFAYDHRPPEISHCNGHYVIRPGAPGNSGEEPLVKRCLPELAVIR